MQARNDIIQRALDVLRKLPQHKAEQVADFAAYVLAQHEDESLRQGIQSLAMEPGPMEFLKNEEDLYTIADLKERFQ